MFSFHCARPSQQTRRYFSKGSALCSSVFNAPDAVFMDFGDAGQSPDVISILVDGRDQIVYVVPHPLNGLSQGLVSLGQLFDSFVYVHDFTLQYSLTAANDSARRTVDSHPCQLAPRPGGGRRSSRPRFVLRLRESTDAPRDKPLRTDSPKMAADCASKGRGHQARTVPPEAVGPGSIGCASHRRSTPGLSTNRARRADDWNVFPFGGFTGRIGLPIRDQLV